jgi:methylamine dehydrogenase heavy chain
MPHRFARRAAPIAATLAALSICLSSGARAADLPVETLTVSPPLTAKNRVYIADIAIAHIGDSQLHVIDGDTGGYLGKFGIGLGGMPAVSNDGKEVYVATTYLSRGQRGTRTDVLEVWDADALAFKYEIEIPQKRAQALQYKGYTRQSSDSRWVLVQNATPATSVTVVDLAKKAVASEVPNPGCFGVFPLKSSGDRFSTICGDGTFMTVTLDADGKPAKRAVSAKLFDADADAWFMSAEQNGDVYHFVSFKGNAAAVDLSGETAKVVDTFPLVTPAEMKKGWRPGGYQVQAAHPASKRLYVAMHEGGAEGSHKNPAKEIWTYDLGSKKRVGKMPGMGATSLAVSADGSKLYAIDIEHATVVVVATGPKPKVVAKQQVGEIPILMLPN